MNEYVKVAVASVLAAGAVTSGVTACSSSRAQSSLGPFTITACMLGWTDGEISDPFFASESAAIEQGNAAQENYVEQAYGVSLSQVLPGQTVPQLPATRASKFSITLTATAVVKSFTVAYYDASGKEIGTGTAELLGTGPNELPAGQTATFMAIDAAKDAASCQVIGSDRGNA
jgi:hypothetical protein